MEDDQLFIVVPNSKLILAHELSDMPYPLIGYLGVALKLWYAGDENGEEVESFNPILFSQTAEIYGNYHRGTLLEDTSRRRDKDELFLSAMMDFIGYWDTNNDPYNHLCDIRICRNKVVLLFTNKEQVDELPEIYFEKGSQEAV